MYAYDKTYLEKARTALGRMLDFAVYDLKYNIEDFFNLFLLSGIAKRFENGDFQVIVGKSGVELAYEVLELTNNSTERISPKYPVGKSEEYWTGHVLAYYQWLTSLSFSQIVNYVPIKTIQNLYSPYHEMDIRQFTDKMNQLYQTAKPETNLKLLRQKAGLTQRQLAELSDVPLRTLQQYEQRQKNINKAQVSYIIRLSQNLYCEPKELLELEIELI